VERRTYGAMSLASNATTTATTATSSTHNSSAYVASNGTISIWEGLIKQTRVALLLQSRKGADSGTSKRYVTTMISIAE